MLQSNQKIIRHKVGLLNLAEELGNVSKACQVMGLSRDTFYRYRDAVEEGGVEALLERTRRVPKARIFTPGGINRRDGAQGDRADRRSRQRPRARRGPAGDPRVPAPRPLTARHGKHPVRNPSGQALHFPHPSRRAHMNELPIIRARSRAEIRPAHRCPAASYARRGRRLRMRPPFTWTSRLSGERLVPVDRIDQVGGAS